ncbi:hypothetical protein BC628DRAFT_779195 [Trametes gibbosa]|nr:hypothetical protein BC628DRAFT_779195 [Trametes gibbosa]
MERERYQGNYPSHPRPASSDMSVNTRTVRRRPRLSNVSRSNTSTTSSATVVEPDTKVKVPPTASQIKPLPPPPRSLSLSFHQHDFNSMVVYADSAVQYHISICMNCFIPSSFITIVRRLHEKGEFVSSFEMGISTQRATVNMHGTEKLMDAVLSRTGRKSDDRVWQWKWDDKPGCVLGWHRDTPVRYCYDLDAAGRPVGPVLAAFVVGALTPDAQDRAPQPASLKVSPDGLHVVDHIMTSALVVERKRLTPSPMSMNSIFN